MELRHIEYFTAVAEHGNFSRAAESLHISQPALSIQIKQLEESLGSQLLDRVGKGAVVTEAGEEFLKHCRRIMSEVDEAKTAIEQMQGLHSGHLTVGVVQTVNACLMPEVISRFMVKYPGITLHVSELSATEIEKGVEDGKLAMGVSFVPCQLEGVTGETLFSEELIVISGKKHRAQTLGGISIRTLKDEPVVMFPAGFHTRKIVEELFARARCAPRIVVETNTIQSILMAVRNTGAITILPRLTLWLAEAKGLHAASISLPSPAKRSVGILWQRGTSHKKAALAFAAELRQFISKSFR